MAKKLIIIDDSSTSLNFLKTAFAKNMWDVYSANSAKDAFEMIFDVVPDLIITDAIMPQIGGFKFVKMVRQDKRISKIPIIIYSVLPESNAKFYIKEDRGEYFLSKRDNQKELLDLAEEVIEKHPLSKEYKNRIILEKLNSIEPVITEEIKENILKEEEEIEKNDLEYKFKEKYNFTISDEKIFSDIFPLLYKILDYNLCVISVNSFEKNEKNIFCDIKGIILSPILQEKLMEKYSASDIILYKKYAPNLKMIINEDEFFSKLEFSFEYKNENIANISFYSKEKSKWQNENNKEILEEVLYRFFKARYVNKKVSNNKKDNFADKYLDKIDFAIFNKSETTPAREDLYTCIIDINNYSELEENISPEDLDIINSKISEKLIKYLGSDEQIYKNDKDEYIAVIYAKDKKQALYKLNSISNILNQISFENHKIEISIGASNCIIDGNYNIYEAQKNARNALEQTNKTEKVIVE